MALSPGTRLGPYEILSALGAGGMGEVYRARDTRLERAVAIKVLPQAFATDTERVARFAREARTLASLNHPHIAALYGLEDADGVKALVMELVEGEDLSQRIARGAISIDEALPIAKQIVEALEAAHEQGIIHRDLKPANIKVREDGTVKVLDFGLAKAMEPASGSSPNVSQSPTITTPAHVRQGYGGQAMTQSGMILGTAAYMSPEQARGRAVDRRADIWAFGAVLFEMLSGRPPFDGETSIELLGSVMHKEPTWGLLPAGTPAPIRHVLRHCLVKDPRNRTHDVADVRIAIESAAIESEHDASVGATPQRDPRSSRLWWTGGALVIGVFLGVFGMNRLAMLRQTHPTAPAAGLVQATIDLPADAPLALGSVIPEIGFNSSTIALSPDGSLLAYIAKTASGAMLYLRDMRSGGVRPLPTTESAIQPFFSPDSQWIGFVTDDHVKKISRQGGAAITLSSAREPVGAWWRGDAIYFVDDTRGTFAKVPAEGGTPERMFTLADAQLFQIDDVLPDGQSALAEVQRGVSGANHDIVQVDLRTRQTSTLISSGYGARYSAAGAILFNRGGNLMASVYDEARAGVAGEPVMVASGVATESLWGISHAASSSTGVLAYVPGSDLSVGRLAWIDRKGFVQYLPKVPPQIYGIVDLAPDDSLIAVQVSDVSDYILLWDPRRMEGRRVPYNGPEGRPLWSYTGQRLAGTGFGGIAILHDIAPGGAATPGVVLKNAKSPQAWSPHDDVLVMYGPSNRMEFLGLNAPINVAAVSGFYASFSPDGRWLAYNSTQSGSQEIFIRSYPDGGVIRQISTGGAVEPRWKRSGDLYFRHGQRWYVTRVVTSPELRWDPPHEVFDADFIDTPGMSYDISADGQRLLVVKRATSVSTNKVNLIVNWPEILRGNAGPH